MSAPASDQQIINRLRDLGIDAKRLRAVLDGHDNWGKLVHAFEALTVMGVVLGAMEKSGDESDDDEVARALDTWILAALLAKDLEYFSVDLPGFPDTYA